MPDIRRRIILIELNEVPDLNEVVCGLADYLGQSIDLDEDVIFPVNAKDLKDLMSKASKGEVL